MSTQHMWVLTLVSTVSEVAEYYGLYDRTVRFACERNQIRARRSGGTWLVWVPDAEARWGNSKPKPGDETETE